jgi:hypothetical protein
MNHHCDILTTPHQVTFILFGYVLNLILPMRYTNLHLRAIYLNKWQTRRLNLVNCSKHFDIVGIARLIPALNQNMISANVTLSSTDLKGLSFDASFRCYFAAIWLHSQCFCYIIIHDIHITYKSLNGRCNSPLVFSRTGEWECTWVCLYEGWKKVATLPYMYRNVQGSFKVISLVTVQVAGISTS